MIHGNHDWAKGKKNGWERALIMERFVEEYLGDQGYFLPAGGCPGPLEVPINETLTLVLLNTQYYLHPWDKPAEDGECSNKSTIEALDELSNVITRNKGKHIVVAGHHPVYTYGEHHGNFSFKQQLLPLPVVHQQLPRH